MNGKFTNRNHYNPCFWTALWNEAYYLKYCSDGVNTDSAREQCVYSLNLRANKILQTKVEQVHFHTNLGVAEITPESMLKFCARWHPDKYDSMREYLAVHPDVLYLDFEEVLTGVEKAAKYPYLMQAAKLGALESVEHKGFLICLLIIHAMRSFEFMAVTVDRMNSVGVDKWEYFWLLKNLWSNPNFLDGAVIVPMLGEWTFWRTSHHAFPLCDSPVMIGDESLMAVLSPRLLLEIDVNIGHDEHFWQVRDAIPLHKYAEFRRRSQRYCRWL